MALTFSASGVPNHTTTGANTVTITIPPGAAVGLIALINDTGGQGVNAGTVTDTGGNTYIYAGGANAGGSIFYCDAWYCLNTTSSATSVSYTPSASYTSITSVQMVPWVWTVSGGTATFGSQNSNLQGSVGTGADAISSGSVTCA